MDIKQGIVAFTWKFGLMAWGKGDQQGKPAAFLKIIVYKHLITEHAVSRKDKDFWKPSNRCLYDSDGRIVFASWYVISKFVFALAKARLSCSCCYTSLGAAGSSIKFWRCLRQLWIVLTEM